MCLSYGFPKGMRARHGDRSLCRVRGDAANCSSGIGSRRHEHLSNAADITTGAARTGSPVEITATYKGITFDPKLQNQRAALTLANGSIYLAWSSHNDCGAYHGWVMAYSASKLTQTGAWLDTPTGSVGDIWMAGQGLTVDGTGSVYVSTGNGDFSTDGTGTNTGNSFVKLTPALTTQDWFTPFNSSTLNAGDQDLGSAGLLGLPGTTYVVGGGKSELHVGPIRKTVTVSGAGSEAPLATIDLFATLEPGIVFSPQTIDFGPAAAGVAHSATITATVDPRLLIGGTMPDLRSSDPSIHITPIPMPTVQRGNRAISLSYKITLDPSAPLGPLSSRLYFTPPPVATPDDGQSLWNVAAVATGQVVGDLSAAPSLLSIGTVVADTGATGTLQLTGSSAAALDGLQVESGLSGVTARIVPPRPPRKRQRWK